ncbi:MAG: hypothetical protein H8D37_06375 [Chloroflexi bacterium]|nr:hypothetical protein [Chloroflexota bacterium]
MARQAALLAAQRKAEAAARRKASLEAELKAEREARLQAAEEARRREQEEARRRAEEAQRKEQMARQAALLKAKLEAEAAARRKASLEAKLKAEREARIKAQAEAANRARAQQEANTAMQVELLRYQRNQPSQQSLADWRQQDMAVADQQVNVRREAETATQVELLRHQQNRSQRQRLAEWKQQDMAIADQRVNIRREAETATQIELLRNQRNRPRLQSLADWKQQDMAEVERYRQQQATAQEVSVPSFWSNSVGWLQAQLINAGRKNETIKEVLVGANNATNAFNQTVGQPIRNTFNAGVQVYGNWVSNPNRPFDLFNKNWWQQKVVVPVVSGVATFVDRATQGAQGLLNLGVYGLHRASQGAQGLLNLGVYGLNRAAQASQAIVSGVGAIVNETVVKPITNGLRAWSGVFENSREIVKALPGYLEEKAKNALTKVITSNAERLYLNRYVPVASWTQQHPFATKFLELVMNTLMNPVRNKVLETLNTDPNTMTWTDIGLSWLFELGQFENDQIVFGPDAVTTKEVMGLDGVVEARQEAIKKIAAGRLDQVVSECATDREIFTGMPQNGEYPVCWSYLYNVPEYYRSLSKASRGGLSEVYIGGYRTYITVEPKGNGVYVFHYEVHNPSTWESGTRFRKDSEDADELNDAIIPSVKPRGEGIHLGGKQDQIWTWDETVDLSGGAKP